MKRVKVRPSVSKEIYNISISDLMACLVFVFIIVVMILAKRFLTYQNRVGKAGGIICKELKNNIKNKRLAHNIKCDDDTHILRLGEGVLFDPGQYELTYENEQDLDQIGRSLKNILLCGDKSHNDLKLICQKNEDGVNRLPLEAILIEGHTDSDPPRHNIQTQCQDKGSKKACIPDNITLSSLRAIAVYKRIKKQLGALGKRRGKDVIGVAGYGAERPLEKCGLKDGNCKKKNRRIEVRFVMSAYEINKK